MNFRNIYIFPITLMLLSGNVFSKELHFVNSPLVFNGIIDESSYIEINKFLLSGGREIIINSEGGDAGFGQKLGMQMSKLGVTLIVDKYCLSSCANYLFLGARKKSLHPNAILGFHGGLGTKINRNVKIQSAVAREIVKLIRREKTFFDAIKVDPRLLEVSLKSTRSDKNFIVVKIEGKENIEKLFPSDQGSAASKFLSMALESEPNAKWSLGVKNEISNKAFFPNMATLLKFGVRGISEYPYPKNQIELDEMVKLISDDWSAVGDFSEKNN